MEDGRTSMFEKTVMFKMNVSDKSIKQEVMKVLWTFSGVTLVDIEEKGILKVKGRNFDETRMRSQLKMIDESVDFTNSSQKTEQKGLLDLTPIFSYLKTPKPQEIIVFEFKVLNKCMKPDVMEAIWEFSGVTSVEVEKGLNIKVKGREFNKQDMEMKVKEIDETVETIFEEVGQEADVKAKSKVTQTLNHHRSDDTTGFKYNKKPNMGGSDFEKEVKKAGGFAGWNKQQQKQGKALAGVNNQVAQNKQQQGRANAGNNQQAQKKQEGVYNGNWSEFCKQNVQDNWNGDIYDGNAHRFDRFDKVKGVRVPYANKPGGETSQTPINNPYARFARKAGSSAIGSSRIGSSTTSSFTTGSSTTSSSRMDFSTIGSMIDSSRTGSLTRNSGSTFSSMNSQLTEGPSGSNRDSTQTRERESQSFTEQARKGKSKSTQKDFTKKL